MTQTHLARVAGVAYMYLRKVEAGDTSRLGIDVFLKICDGLGADPLDILRRAGWAPRGGVGRGELDAVIGELDTQERNFVLRMSRALLDMRRARVQALPGAGGTLAEPVAAYDREVPREDEWPEKPV